MPGKEKKTHVGKNCIRSIVVRPSFVIMKYAHIKVVTDEIIYTKCIKKIQSAAIGKQKSPTSMSKTSNIMKEYVEYNFNKCSLRILLIKF